MSTLYLSYYTAFITVIVFKVVFMLLVLLLHCSALLVVLFVFGFIIMLLHETISYLLLTHLTCAGGVKATVRYTYTYDTPL